MDTEAAPNEIYLGRDGARSGPYTMDELRTLVGEGRFTPYDWAWYPGAAQWMAIRELPGFTLSSLPRPPGYRPPVSRTVGLVRYAGFWIRVAAHLIDGIILFVPVRAVGRLVPGEKTGDPVADIAVELGVFALKVCVTWAYRAGFHASRWQATIGKRAVGIRVTDLAGRRITFSHATGRYLAEILSAWTLGVGYVMAGLSSRKQALHDRVVGTLVLYR